MRANLPEQGLVLRSLVVLSSVQGQDRVVALLRRAIEQNRLAHAYLFSGPIGAPLVDTALALAGALNCTTKPGEGCGACIPCEKIASGIHPDVVTLVREGAGQIVPIENVRNQVIARLGLPPHEADVRVFIIEEATAMAPPAANALLKTLEEPPARTLFVLCTTAPEQLLPTIRSRCQRVRFAGVDAAAAVGDDVAKAARVAALAEDLVGAVGGEPRLGLAGKIAEGKGEPQLIVLAAAQRLHARASAAAAAGELGEARRDARAAEKVLAWHTPLAIHHANPALAIEALIGELVRL
jgi:DNA polymerase III delta' subunit